MRAPKTFLVAMAFLLISGPIGAQANIIWDWTADCPRILFGSRTLCNHSTLHAVTTDAYVPGTEGGASSPHVETGLKGVPKRRLG